MTLQTGAIAWQNAASGVIGAWNLNAGAFAGGNTFENIGANSPWKLKGSANFDSKGGKDLVWQNSDTGEVGIWYNDGSKFNKVLLKDNPGSAWEVGGVGDVNNDGSNDIFFLNRQTGESAVWAFNGVQRDAAIATSYITKDKAKLVVDVAGLADWKFGGIADFTGDGKSDILWHNTKTEQLGYWEMNGDQLVSVDVKKYGSTKGWSVKGVNDFTSDGKADILWQEDATGKVGYWEMNGKTFVSGKTIANQPANLQGWNPVASFDTSVLNPLAEYKGARQNIQLNFSPDSGVDTHAKNAAISLAGIVEGAIGGRTNLPKDFTLKLSVDKSAVENLNAILALN